MNAKLNDTPKQKCLFILYDVENPTDGQAKLAAKEISKVCEKTCGCDAIMVTVYMGQDDPLTEYSEIQEIPLLVRVLADKNLKYRGDFSKIEAINQTLEIGNQDTCRHSSVSTE